MVQEHDPYEEMLEEAKDSTRPSLPGDESRKKEESAKKKESGESAKSELSDAESNAAGGLYKNGASAKEQEEDAGGFRSSVGGVKGKKKKGLLGGKFKAVKASVGIVVFLVVILLAAVVAVGSPIFQIGHLDFNLQDSLGFTKTTGILQKQASYIVEDDLSKGKVPSTLASDLAKYGIDVGQVTANGDFVRTNEFIANLDELKDVASLGHYEVEPSNGELAILYDGQVIAANEFVETVESNLKMFADYTKALDIAARFYYSDEVDQIYKDMGLSRSTFSEWVDTGDLEKNQEQFEKMLKDALNNNSDLVISAYNAESSGETSRVRTKNTMISPSIVEDSTSGDTTDVTGETDTATGEDAETSGEVMNQGSWQEVTVSDGSEGAEIVQDVANSVTGSNARNKAAQLLNAAISAGEPYLAASAFIGVISPIQQARIEGTGPVNEVMNALYAENKVKYTDVETGETVSEEKSIITTDNFVAAVSGGKFSKTKAISFARDRALATVGMNDYDIIINTSVASAGQEESKMLIPVSSGDSANADELMVLKDSVSKAMVDSNYGLWTSVVGGNRAIEGGSFLSNTINSHTIGALPSDEMTIAAYNREAKTEMARMAAAERATKSPFDISSPYTFMGSIAHGFANAIIQSGGVGNVVSGSIGTVANMTDNSSKTLFGSVIADGEDDSDYGASFGDYCTTVKTIGVEGDIYCTAHTTLSTGYMRYNDDDWKNALGGNLDESGSINEDSDLGTFVDIAMDRWATVGVQSAEACERWKEKNASGWTKIGDFFSNALSLYDSCGGVGGDDDTLKQVATGVYYANSDSNEGNRDVVKLFSAYALHDTVASLLDGSVSKVTELRNKIYAKRSVDDSRAGKIARISGMSKREAEVALAYADYLSFIARYDPAERYAFGVDLMPPESHGPLMEHASQVAVDLYVMWHGRTEYDDLRTRTRVA